MYSYRYIMLFKHIKLILENMVSKREMYSKTTMHKRHIQYDAAHTYI